MKTSSIPLVALVSGVVLTGSVSMSAQDWPQWRGPNRDGKVSGFTAPEKWPAALPQKWKTTVGSGDATPALVGDKLYVFSRQGAEEVILCLNAADGKEIWRNKYEAQTVSGPAGSHPGPRSSPAVAEGKVVTLGVGGVLSCLDAATGSEVWRKDEFPKVVPQFFTSSSPLIVNGMAIAHLGGKGTGAVIAYDLSTGKERWKWGDEAPAYASPSLMTVDGVKQFVTLTEKSVVGLNVADGKLLWQIAFAPSGRMSYNTATVVVDGQTVIYTGSGRGTKAAKIEKQGDGFAAKELWSNADMAPQFNSPILKNGMVFGLNSRGNFFCLNAQTGQSTWTDAGQQDNKGFGSILDAGSVLLALAPKSELIVFKPSEKEYSEVARIKVAESATYAHPVVAGKRVFVKDQDSLAMLTIE